jgi:YidC/Oxa1 family membrane protein insertase
MEDKRTAFAILLIIMVVMVYSDWFMTPAYKRSGAANAPQAGSTTGAAASAQPEQPLVPAATPGTTASLKAEVAGAASHPTPAELQAAQTITVETNSLVLTINQLGGRVVSAKLKAYHDKLGSKTAYDLISSSDKESLPLGVYSGGESDERTQYSLTAAGEGALRTDNNFVLGGTSELALTFSGALPDGTGISKIFRFFPNSYLFNLEVKLSSAPKDGSSLWLEFTHYFPDLANQDRLNPVRLTILDENGKLKHITPQEVTAGLMNPAPAKWIGFDDKYFGAILISAAAGQNISYGREGNVLFQRTRGEASSGNFSVYLGPKEYDTLKQLGFQLERSIDLGFFSFLAYPLLLMLRVFHDLLRNYGLAIVLLTLAVKAAFFPLTRASMKSMQAMQALQPEMKALRERIKDPTQLNQEVLALYKKHGVNPMGGCLPMVIQIPVFFGLYSALQNAVELRHARFALWITDLSAPERLEAFGINLPVMILIMGATMFVQQYLTPNPSSDPAQRKMMLWMSLVFTGMFLIYPFPAGLALYMLVNSTISVVQQAYLRSDKKVNPFMPTALASVGIFAVAYILTLI